MINEKDMKKKSEDVLSFIRVEICDFVVRLAKLNKKWANSKWISQEYQNHIDECEELQSSDDVHYIAELMDKAIIAQCYTNLKPESVTDEMREAITKSIDELMAELNRVNFIVPEYDGTVDGALDERKRKFLAKIHLNPEFNID